MSKDGPKYNHSAIEKKWQKKWEDAQAFKAIDDSSKEKNYLLVDSHTPRAMGCMWATCARGPRSM